MIHQIKELNFPQYATISTATAQLLDMGDMSITAQVKIDGAIKPDFSFDWEVEFQGERYIHTAREPQASKGNDSICSIIDLTFNHWTIYQLRRYYFVSIATLNSGTAIADLYITSLSANLKTLCDAFQEVLDYYFNGEIRIDLNPQWKYDEEVSYLEINYTHIWDVLQKIYEVYGVRWHIKGKTIYVGYSTDEVSHIFEYGFEGGLLKVERQVQSTEIRNSLLGRGGEKNLPYRYFKNVDTNNPTFQADPDWIPELENIYFTKLRGKTFRDYIKGWKAHRYGGTPMTEPTEEYIRGFEDSSKSSDGRYFNPIEYVEDKESIEKYGLLQGSLGNQDDVYPTIQGVEMSGIGRVDQIVGAEKVVIDEYDNDTSQELYDIKSIKDTFTYENILETNVDHEYILKSETIHDSFDKYLGSFVGYPTFDNNAIVMGWHNMDFYMENVSLTTEFISARLIDVKTNEYINETTTIPNGIKFKIEYRVRVTPVYVDGKPVEAGFMNITSEWSLVNNISNGLLLNNIDSNGSRKHNNVSIGSHIESSTTLKTDTFKVKEGGATSVDVPINIVASKDAQGLYEWKRDSIEAINVDTGEVVSSINIPKGTYYLRVNVDITNNSSKTQTYKVELLPSYIYYPSDKDEFKPTFNIWIKNIWESTRRDGESDVAYTERVWTPILGDRQENEARVVFSSGNLSGHSDWEFSIKEVQYAGNSGVKLGDVDAEWKLTLIKSNAELNVTGKYIPSTQIQANAGDFFYFIGIDMPHQYTLWAEEKLDQIKADKLIETSNIKPVWVVQIDKIRLNQMQPNEREPLLNSLKVGNTIRLADKRFIPSPYELLYLQSVTYSWGADTTMLPNVEVVLSDKVLVSLNPVEEIQGQIDSLAKQVGSISNIQQIVKSLCDKMYLRKDGLDDISISPTKFNNDVRFDRTLSSGNYRQGALGGSGWGLRTDGQKGILEVDKLVVRDDFQVNTIVYNQIEARGGKQIESAARIVCSDVKKTDDGYVCFFDTKRGSVVNLFKVNDIAYSQVFSPDNQKYRYYKRNVIKISDNSITLSLDGDGNSIPQVGDVIVHYGNTEDVSRQYVIIRDVIGGGYERMLSNLNSVTSTGDEYYFAGRLDGDSPRWFVGDKKNDFAEWVDGKLTIKGEIILKSGDVELDGFLSNLSKKITDVEEGISFDEDGKITNISTSGLVLAKGYGLLHNVYIDFDEDGKIKSENVSGILTKEGAVEIFASKELEDGNKIIGYINQDATTTTIHASKIDIEGQVKFSSFSSDLQETINNKVDSKTIIDGGFIKTELINTEELVATNVEATTGSIGGFEIKDNALTVGEEINGLTLAPKYFHLIYQNTWGGQASHKISATFGATEDYLQRAPFYFYKLNTASPHVPTMEIVADNGPYIEIALQASQGLIIGREGFISYGLNLIDLTSSIFLDFKKGNCYILKNTSGSSKTVYLPRAQEVQELLGVNNFMGENSIMINIVSHYSSTNEIKLKQYSGKIYNHNGGEESEYTLQKGDSITFLLVYYGGNNFAQLMNHNN